MVILEATIGLDRCLLVWIFGCIYWDVLVVGQIHIIIIIAVLLHNSFLHRQFLPDFSICLSCLFHNCFDEVLINVIICFLICVAIELSDPR